MFTSFHNVRSKIDTYLSTVAAYMMNNRLDGIVSADPNGAEYMYTQKSYIHNSNFSN